MTKLTKEVIDKMTNQEIRTAAKSVGIKYGKLSKMQIQAALVGTDPKAPKVKAVKGPRAPKVGTKMEKATEYFKANKSMARKDLIKYFMEKIGLTKPGANTYHQLIKKKLA